MRRPLFVVLTCLTLIVSVAFGAAQGASGSARTDIRSKGFAFRAIDIPDSDFGEPSIAISAKDHVFVCGPLGTPAGNNGFIRTSDWTHFQRQNVFDPAGGGDCDVKVGADGAGYTASLQIVGSRIRKSVDDGTSVS